MRICFSQIFLADPIPPQGKPHTLFSNLKVRRDHGRVAADPIGGKLRRGRLLQPRKIDLCPATLYQQRTGFVHRFGAPSTTIILDYH